MRYIKLFEEVDFGRDLSTREKKILRDIIGDYLDSFEIKVDDGYYHTSLGDYENEFDGFNELKDYLSLRYYFRTREIDKLLDIYRSTTIDPSFDECWLIRCACESNQLELVKIFLNDKRMNSDLGDCIHLASVNGHEEIVKLLLKDPKLHFDDVISTLKLVVRKNHMGVFKILMESDKVFNSDHIDVAFIEACIYGRLEAIKLLLVNKNKNKTSDTTWYNVGFGKACVSGHIEIVKYLLKDKELDPSFQKNEAIRNVYNNLSVANGKWEIIELLLSDPRVIEKLTPEQKILYKAID